MDEKYFPKKIEQKWQKRWAETRAFEADGEDGEKFYQLEMLPYPSGQLHMGHVRNYTAGDVVAWYKRLRGFRVLHPMGWDSFGQPAEDAAIKRGVDPRAWTEENIVAMRSQLQSLGLSYDWRREIAAHRPEYYKFDQWFFLKMLELGLAYKKTTLVNWCENDQATLSNEQASGGLCWRCGNPVTKKSLEQWFLRITKYADELLEGLDRIEPGWPAHVVKRQRDWIGRSEGAFIDFPAGEKETIRIFTTRIDTIYGANCIVVAAEHPFVDTYLERMSTDARAKIDEMRREKLRPDTREMEIEKDGVDTGLRATNPFSGEKLPVWVGNYVMMEYGTGAIMSVPAHDERDHEFARKFGLPIVQVIEPAEAGAELPWTGEGTMMNSAEWNGLQTEKARSEMTANAAERGFGSAAVTYRIRDWGISRQRFWGSPIPIVYCEKCGVVPERFENLPVELPENVTITGSGESPLANVPEFVAAKCPECGGDARRETDTMDTFVDSSWYFFRYTDPHNDSMPFDKSVAMRWAPVDQYIGGDDHAVMHLIYTRFWSKVMRDLGLVTFDEPVLRLLTQGMVVGETFFDDSSGKRVYHPPDTVDVSRDEKGKIVSARAADGSELKHAIERMSKSKGNGVDPNEMVDIYGADATRLFVMFAAPIENELVWHEAGIEGAVRFLQRVWRLVHRWHGVEAGVAEEMTDAARALRRKTHQTIHRVAESLESLQFNTPVAALMELSNAIQDSGIEPGSDAAGESFAVREALEALTVMLASYAPHAAEEMYSAITGADQGILAGGVRFPQFSEELAREDAIEIAVQVNGKLRSRIFAEPGAENSRLEEMALADERVREFTSDREIARVVVVPGRLVNIVVRP